MENLSDLLEKLRISLSSDETSNSDGAHPPDAALVRAVVDALKKNEEVIPVEEIQKMLPRLKSCFRESNSNLTATLLEFTAEICKSEDARQACVDSGLIPCVLSCIETKQIRTVLHQALRAIGNIACDNNKAREEILENGGVQTIIRRLTEVRIEEGKNYEAKLHITACGAVLNISLDNEMLQKEFIENEAILWLLGYVEDNIDTNLSLMAANAISCLLEVDESVSNFAVGKGCGIFVKALKYSSGEFTTALAECLRVLSEEDRIKRAMVSENCVDILQEIISTNLNSNEKEDILQKMKIAVDLIILLLGDDNCLGKLFAEENSMFVDKILLWTQSTDAYVRNSCPVAIGNIARTETNCIRLVKMEIHHKLIGLLREDSHNVEADKIQLKISVLSALKNLAIPASNKRVLIDAGALDCAAELLCSTETPSPLVFRAIAVIRLLVHGQDAAVDTICSQEQCIINLVSLAQNSGIEGLKSEASRLLAALLKNARTSESILAVVKNNGLKQLVTMITSTHATMQNEALVGIVMAVNIINDEHSQKIDESNLLATINKVLCADNAEPQTQYNSMAVIEALFVKGFVEKSNLEDSGILHNLETLTSHSHDAIKQRATAVIHKIKSSNK